jgi:hypothetical protein
MVITTQTFDKSYFDDDSLFGDSSDDSSNDEDVSSTQSGNDDVSDKNEQTVPHPTAVHFDSFYYQYTTHK